MAGGAVPRRPASVRLEDSGQRAGRRVPPKLESARPNDDTAPPRRRVVMALASVVASSFLRAFGLNKTTNGLAGVPVARF